ncbi:peptidoglycan-N-acetylglucosamine deacetylase [bacterium BMS3Abin07]|nr:peptidoglycan-N-acetylglucosamine deacetylase [bacterium BMS3Abin07]
MLKRMKLNGLELIKIPIRSAYRIIRKPVSFFAPKMLEAITHVETKDPVVALTFDGGPDPRWTPRLLDILNRYQARATFFMLGKYAERHPEIVRRAAEAGHAICNHTWDHPSPVLISMKEFRHQIRSCSRAIFPYESKIYRPPWGHQTFISYVTIRLLGYKVVTWNLHALDWLDQDPEWMAKYLETKIKPGSIVLLHDVVCVRRNMSRESTLRAVNLLLERISDRFSFITVPELFCHGQPQLTYWNNKPDVKWWNRNLGVWNRYKEQNKNQNANIY